MGSVSDSNFADLALLHSLRGLEVPPIARALAGDREPELVWRNDLGGLTFRRAPGWIGAHAGEIFR